MSEVAAGQSLAGYRLIELGGSGGMGRVYRAIQPRIDRVVAVKVIRPDLAADQAFREGFEVEFRLAASIDHPNVVSVYEADESDGVLFVAMRWVEGPDLRELLATEGPIAPARAVDLLRQLADGLDAAHAKGLIHRDIKPANVLLEGEHAFLSDFGLAQTTFGGDATTRVGGLVGTVDYLAPELVDGGTATIAGDVYALGCVLYEMLTGSVPFPVEGLIPKLHAHATADPPAPSALDPELPRGFDEVVGRALAKDPDRRYASAGELAAAARRALRTAPRRPPRTTPRRRAGLLAVGCVVVLALIAALLLVLTGGHGTAHAGSGGQTLPAAASLHPCGDLLTASAGDCRNTTGGVTVLAGPGATARMRTMDFEVTRVVQSDVIEEPLSGDTVTAPPGQRFIVLECVIANRMRTTQVFEPNQFAGRQTSLDLYAGGGEHIPLHGPHFADYAEQNLPATGLLPLSPIGERFLPPRRGGLKLAAVLAFSYPTSDLRSAHTMMLSVGEFGQGLADESSLGVFRLPVTEGEFRPVYKAAGI